MPDVPVSLWKKALVPLAADVTEVIRCLDESKLQIALVVSADGALAGTVTDGDIRRGLLHGVDLADSIDTVICRDPLVVPLGLDSAAALQIMEANKVHQLPVIDDSRRVVGLHVWEQLMSPKQRDNLMVIMAGGRGTRLQSHTEDCPKPLLPLGGKPMLEHIILRARAQGFQQFVLAIHYLGDMIEQYFGDGSRWEVRVEYLREEFPLGTAGALGLLSPRPEEPLLISNGDVLTDIRYADLVDFHCRQGATATMAVRPYEWEHPFGVVHTKGVDISGFEEKPVARSHINAGVYVLAPPALDALVAGEPCDMPTLFDRLRAREARTIVYPMHEPWLDVGHVDNLSQAEAAHRLDRER